MIPYIMLCYASIMYFFSSGRKAGFLGSAYFIGSFAGSLMWGWLSDVWGRRPTLLSSIFGIIVSAILFGFSQNFAWAVSARLMWGLLNGVIGIAKTYISEVCKLVINQL